MVKERLQKWQRGELETLWCDFKEEAARVKTERRSNRTEEERRVARAKRLAENGLYGRACDALTSQGMHGKSEEVQAELKNLHPTGAPVESPQPSMTEPLEFEKESVKAAVESFERLVQVDLG